MEQVSPTEAYAPPTSVKDWLITLIITSIPVVGIIMLFVWAFSSGVNTNKQNFAKATLIMTVIAIVFGIIMMAIFKVTFWDNLQKTTP